MVALWVTIMVVVDDNNVVIDLTNIDPNIDNKKEEEIDR